jgi:hypothetical protein
MRIKSERLKNKKGMELKTFVISWLIQNKNKNNQKDKNQM